jgi:DnaJ-class molecular chaperone
MLYCQRCGKRYDVDARYCSNCGNPLIDRKETVRDSQIETSRTRKRERENRCPYCNATGSVEGPMSGPETVTCPVCNGRRYNSIPEDWLKCRECGSTGEFTYGSGNAISRKPCPECKGKGWAPE